MAHGFLKSFDNRIEVASAGTEPSGKINQKAVEVMKDLGIDISHHTSDPVDMYLDDVWDYVITVCDDANEVCPVFTGKVKQRLHTGFEDPSYATGTEDFIHSEYLRVRDEIREAFCKLYSEEIKSKL